MASAVYNAFKSKVLQGTYKLDNMSLCMLLVTDTYSVDIDAHDFRDDITGEVAATTGYVAGGKALSTPAVSQDDTDNEGVLDAADMLWGSSCITARGAVIYGSTGTDTTDPLVCYIDFGADYVSASPGYFQVVWNAEGILNLG